MFRLSSYLDAQERRLIVQSIIIGVAVWAVVYALKTAVHEWGHAVLHFIQEQPTSILIPLVFGSLLLGSIFVAGLTQTTAKTIHYRDSQGKIHELRDIEGDGLERAISLYYTSEPTFENSLLGDDGVEARWQLPTFTLAARKAVATLATLVSGGSGGLEASVTLIGESLSAGIVKPRVDKGENRFLNWWQPTDPDDLQTAQLSGIAAAVSTLLGAPFTAAFFATEVMYRKRPIIEKLIYSLISALVAFFLNTFVHNRFNPEESVFYEIPSLFESGQTFTPPLGNWHYYVLLAGMVVSISLFSSLFGLIKNRLDDWFHYRFKNIWVQHMTGAALTGAIAVTVFGIVYGLGQYQLFGFEKGSYHHALELVLGTGESVINDALAGELILAAALIALLAKMIATLITIGSGGSAGLLVPSLFYGTMIATLFLQVPAAVGASEVWDFSSAPLVLIAPAMTAALVSIVNVPLASILFAVEIFSGSYMIPSLIALVIAQLFTYQTSIYRSQRETYQGRQILPGYSTRRFSIPKNWNGKTLAELDLRRVYDVTVIGWVDSATEQEPHVHLSTDANRPLNQHDVLVIIGKDEDIARMIAGSLDLDSSGVAEESDS